MKKQLLGLLKKRHGLWSEQPGKAWMSICVCLAPSGRCPQLYPLPEKTITIVVIAMIIVMMMIMTMTMTMITREKKNNKKR